MKFRDKRGMEVAASTIVMLIVGIVVLGFSLMITQNLFCSAQEYEATISSQNQQEINRLLAGGGNVVVPNNAKTARTQGSFICGSSRTQAVDFALGIQNRGQGPAEYVISISRESPEGDLFDNEILFGLDDIRLGPGEQVVETFIINLPLNAPPGQYQYLVHVQEGGELHGAQIVYVTVP